MEKTCGCKKIFCWLSSVEDDLYLVRITLLKDIEVMLLLMLARYDASSTSTREKALEDGYF